MGGNNGMRKHAQSRINLARGRFRVAGTQEHRATATSDVRQCGVQETSPESGSTKRGGLAPRSAAEHVEECGVLQTCSRVRVVGVGPVQQRDVDAGYTHTRESLGGPTTILINDCRPDFRLSRGNDRRVPPGNG
jgi:hypothetical protein